MAEETVKDPVTKKLSVAEMQEETARIALESAKRQERLLELQEKAAEYQIRDLKSTLENRDIKELQAKEDREAQGRTFAQQEATDVYRFSICTHKKGGTANPRDVRVLSTGGNANQYAVIKHQMINGDIWVRCLRCGKTWSPPVEENFYYAKGKIVPPKMGTFDKEKYMKANEEYVRATMFETNNSMSTSVQCRFTRFNPETGRQEDAADIYRTNVKDSNLR